MKVLLQKGGPGKTFKLAILEWLRDVKGWEVTAIEESKDSENFVNPKAKLYVWPDKWNNYYTKSGSLHIVEEHYEDKDGYTRDKNFYTDLDLIEAVETLGDDNFKVVEIPDDVDWELEEDHGVFYAVEKHRTWS
jgi:hypothetical protein